VHGVLPKPLCGMAVKRNHQKFSSVRYLKLIGTRC